MTLGTQGVPSLSQFHSPPPDGPRIHFEINPQPDDFTCGPTCLQAVYRYFGDPVELAEVITSVETLNSGGTLAIILACDALRRGYRATIYSYNITLFDPTWFSLPMPRIRAKLIQQAQHKPDQRLQLMTRYYVEFLDRGGTLRFRDMSHRLIQDYLKQGIPILTGLSSTYLYRSERETGPEDDYDDILGEPSGHFVVLSGYEKETRMVQLADPLESNPMDTGLYYSVGLDRLINSILLGVLTDDANLLLIEPRKHVYR